VLHAIPEMMPVTSFPGAGETAWIPPENLEADTRKALEALVAKVVGRRRVPVEPRVELGDPFQRIMDAARGVDSIIIGTVGRTGLAHLLIGSVAEKVVRHSPVPVLTVRPDAAARVARRAKSALANKATSRPRRAPSR
jgi:nucleotide-binding universal stress UspA family protein